MTDNVKIVIAYEDEKEALHVLKKIGECKKENLRNMEYALEIFRLGFDFQNKIGNFRIDTKI